ncbi:MAG: hypothetical protein ABFD89_06315 [Bryobacteraceae bacterium]
MPCEHGTEERPELTVCDACLKDESNRRLVAGLEQRIENLRKALKDCAEMYSPNAMRAIARKALDADVVSRAANGIPVTVYEVEQAEKLPPIPLPENLKDPQRIIDGTWARKHNRSIPPRPPPKKG